VKKTTVLYHRDADGFGAAFALWQLYDNTANYISVQYKEPVPEIPEGTQTLFIVDFSYDRATCEALAAKYKLTVIDHHKTSQKELEGLPYVIFDMEKSGAVLTWEYLYAENRPVPAILQYVQDRDLWRFHLPRSEEVNLAIASMEEKFEVWAEFNTKEAVQTGAAIKAFRDRQIRDTVRDASESIQFGHKAVVVNCTANISETGAALLEKFPEARFAMLYADRKGATMRSYSLRSRGDFDVSAIAKAQGGGGHPAAAGFVVPNPVSILFY